MRSVDNAKAFSIYTNPKMGEIYIDFETQSSKAYYRVLNKKGKIVCQNNNPIVRNTVALRTLPIGLYTLEVNSENMIISKKFLRL